MITVLCPAYNEEKYITQLLEFFTSALPAEKELLIIDGGSTDNTVAIIKEWTKKYPNIKLFNNPDKYVPFALNIGIQNSSGEIIIRLDAHTHYESDYFSKILETYSNVKADIVGGPMRAKGTTAFQKAVAYCTSHSFGVGNSAFHDDTLRGYVDSVYLGAWKREIFRDTGLFDVNMIRNQDDEFHYRAKSLGKLIYLNPDIKSWYFPRSSLKKLFSQYFQYGYFKPLVLKKVSSEIKPRHLIPSAFTLYFLTLPISYLLVGNLAFLPAVIYLLLNVYFSSSAKGSFQEKLWCLLIFPCLHLAYGSGFIIGFFRMLFKSK